MYGLVERSFPFQAITAHIALISRDQLIGITFVRFFSWYNVFTCLKLSNLVSIFTKLIY